MQKIFCILEANLLKRGTRMLFPATKNVLSLLFPSCFLFGEKDIEYHRSRSTAHSTANTQVAAENKKIRCKTHHKALQSKLTTDHNTFYKRKCDVTFAIEEGRIYGVDMKWPCHCLILPRAHLCSEQNRIFLDWRQEFRKLLAAVRRSGGREYLSKRHWRDVPFLVFNLLTLLNLHDTFSAIKASLASSQLVPFEYCNWFVIQGFFSILYTFCERLFDREASCLNRFEEGLPSQSTGFLSVNPDKSYRKTLSNIF